MTYPCQCLYWWHSHDAHYALTQYFLSYNWATSWDEPSDPWILYTVTIAGPQKTADIDGFRYSPDDPHYGLGPSIRLSMFELRETSDWDIFLGPPERARTETGGADQWVLKRRELPGFAIVNEKKRPHPWDTHHQFSIKTLLSNSPLNTINTTELRRPCFSKRPDPTWPRDLKKEVRAATHFYAH